MSCTCKWEEPRADVERGPQEPEITEVDPLCSEHGWLPQFEGQCHDCQAIAADGGDPDCSFSCDLCDPKKSGT